MSCALIINPLSRSGRSKRVVEPILDQCRRENIPVDFVFASTYESIISASQKANKEGIDQIIAVGGDGTINAVLNGFFDDQGGRISDSRLGVIYTGTSPDFCRSYGIPLDRNEAIGCLKNGAVRKIFPGKITFHHDEIAETRFFACCTNIGIGASVARDANRSRKYWGDTAGTFLSLVKNISKYRQKSISLSIDGQVRKIERVLNISIGKTPYIASGIKVRDHMIGNEGFYIMIASDFKMKNIPGLLRQIYSGNIRNKGYLMIEEGRRIMMSSQDPDIEVEFDGDPAGYLPCTIEPSGSYIELITGVA